MTSPIKKGRWKSAEEIIDKIAQVTRKIARYRLAADELFLRVKHEAVKQAPMTAMTDTIFDNVKNLRDTAQRKLDKAAKLEAGYLQKLKRKLAEFQTELLPMEGNTDRTIPK